MKFYKLDEVPILNSDQVFRISKTGKVIAMLIMYGIAITSLVLAVRGGRTFDLSSAFYYYFAAVVALFGLIPLGRFRASLRPSAWLARCNDEGIIIKYRSFLNWRLPADSLQAVGFDWREIASARLVKEHRTSPSMDSRGGTEIQWLTYIDLTLAKPDTSLLETHLREERNCNPDGKIVNLDYPVQTLPGGIVEVSWADGISPSAHKAVALLARHITITETEHRKTDLTRHRNATPEDARAHILLLAKSGNEMAAIKLAQQSFGYNLTQATEYVENLESDGSGKAD